MTQYPSIIAFYALFFASVLFAFAKGGAPERIGAAGYLFLATLQVSSSFILPYFYTKVDGIGLLTDLAALLIFGAIALSAKRTWPLWAASLQLLAVSTHFSRWVDLQIDPYAYSLMKSMPTAFALVALALGTLLHQRRLKRYGSDPDWVDWNTASAPA